MSDPGPAEFVADFASRHIGPSPQQRGAMLDELGYRTIDDLLAAAVPESIRMAKPLDLPPAMTEPEATAELTRLAGLNTPRVSMLGLGYYPTVTPAVIRRNVLEDPSWYTAYTPYQPEISQGRLEALLNFQTMISDLTGLPIANASLLDEATAAAEALSLARRARRGRGPTRLIVDEDCLPQTIAVAETRARAMGLDIEVRDVYGDLPDGDLTAVLVQYPGASGQLRDIRPVIDAAHGAGALAIVAADLLALTLVEAPGTLGADIVVGSSQRFGVPMFGGGPHAAFIAVAKGLERQTPGRLVGVSLDAEGRPAYRLALQTREQHIRRDKATSNICTAQVLLAVVAAMYAVYHGPRGLAAIAARINRCAVALATALGEEGFVLVHRGFFDTILVECPGRSREIAARAHEAGVLVGADGADRIRVSCSEVTTAAHLRAVLVAFGADHERYELAGIDAPDTATQPEKRPVDLGIDDAARRTTEFLTHPVFTTHRSETSMLRYLKRLARRDYALDRGMIPLGSCTMKLNATTELEPITLAGFADIHPFAPAADTAGFSALAETLEAWLAEITGYAAVSIQPNAGSQGELAGLMAIHAYHRANGDDERDVCLIPSSAHGTNAASAVMAGMRVVVVKATGDGSIDVEDLTRLCEEYADQLSAVMVTYPSTHGVFEDTIVDLCEIVHRYGGQVYLDGANLNALVGLAKPGLFGGDVSHLNLHKTFCIPHGGGGPGVGPVAVAAHLAAFLPTHPMHPDEGRREGIGPVSAAPFGSAGILPISWAYIAMMGSEGLTEATSVAILSANYLASRLRAAYPVLYTGHGGLVAHECILDLRGLTKATGVTVEDVAKRLVDYGFHAPTMSFPVPGTLMVEPTESEDLGELDRFCDAMLAIRGEIEAIERGEVSRGDSPLAHAPHTMAVLAGPWDRAYSRQIAAFPNGDTSDKYWPPVARIDQAYGDRNLMCACPSPADFAEPPRRAR